MDFELTPEQREIQGLTRELAEGEIVPNAAAWDREHRFPAELFPKLADLGLMGVCVPEEYGGAGAKGTVRPSARPRGADRRLRIDRVRVRLRRGLAADAGGAGR